MAANRTFTPKIGDGFEMIANHGEIFPARIICTDASIGGANIIALVKDLSGGEGIWVFNSIGASSGGRLYDAPRIVERWANVYPHTIGDFHPTREEADEHASANRIGLLHYQAIDGKLSNPEFVE